MAKIYAEIIIKGLKNISDVPARIKEQVKVVLGDLGYADLAEEE